MRYPFIRALLFLLIGFAVLHGLACLARQTTSDENQQFLEDEYHNVELLERHAEDVEALALGNSHAGDVEFMDIDYEGLHLTRAWGDLFEVHYLLDHFVPRLPNLEAVFIPISYFTFEWDNSAADYLIVRREDLYRATDAWNFIPGDFKFFAIAKVTKVAPVHMIMREDHWRDIVSDLLSYTEPSPEEASTANGCENLTRQQLRRHAQRRARAQIQLIAEIAEHRPNIQKDTYERLASIIGELQRAGIRVVLFTPPYYQHYTDIYQAEYPHGITLMLENIATLQHDYGIEYYDFSQNEAISKDYTLFYDSDHLNACGRALFSTSLNNRLFPATPRLRQMPP